MLRSLLLVFFLVCVSSAAHVSRRSRERVESPVSELKAKDAELQGMIAASRAESVSLSDATKVQQMELENVKPRGANACGGACAEKHVNETITKTKRHKHVHYVKREVTVTKQEKVEKVEPIVHKYIEKKKVVKKRKHHAVCHKTCAGNCHSSECQSCPFCSCYVNKCHQSCGSEECSSCPHCMKVCDTCHGRCGTSACTLCPSCTCNSCTDCSDPRCGSCHHCWSCPCPTRDSYVNALRAGQSCETLLSALSTTALCRSVCKRQPEYLQTCNACNSNTAVTYVNVTLSGCPAAQPAAPAAPAPAAPAAPAPSTPPPSEPAPPADTPADTPAATGTEQPPSSTGSDAPNPNDIDPNDAAPTATATATAGTAPSSTAAAAAFFL